MPTDTMPRSPARILIITNTVSQLIGKIFTMLATLLATFLIAGTFGPQGYGDFTKATAYVALFYLLTDFGLNAIFVRDTDRDPAISIGNLLSLRLAISAVLVFCAIALTVFLPGSGTDGFTAWVKLGIILYTPTILFQSVTTTGNAVFQKSLRYGRSALAVATGGLVTLIAVYLIARIIRPEVALYWLVSAYAAGSLVTSLISISLSEIRLRDIAESSWRSMYMFIRRAIPFGLTLVVNVIYFRADILIISLTRPTAEVGLYGLAYRFFEVPLVIPTFFMNSVYPLLTAGGSDSADRRHLIRPLLLKSSGIMLPASLIVLVAGFYASGILAFIRTDFVPSIPALKVLLLGMPAFFLSSVTMWSMVALGKQKQLLATYGSVMLLNITANLIFIPRFSFMAAAWVTVVSEFLILIISIFMLRKWLFPGRAGKGTGDN